MSLGTSKTMRIVSAVLLLLVIVMTGLVWTSFGDCPGSFQRTLHTIVLGDKDFISRTVRFRVRGSGAFGSPTGHLSGFTTLRASDCVDVASLDEDEGSPSQAVDEFEKRIRGAVRIVERCPIRNEDSGLVGERVVLVEEGPKAEIIFLQKGRSKLFVIESKSLAHALAFEKLIQRGFRHDANGYVVGQGK
jgi:hypothetical protein